MVIAIIELVWYLYGFYDFELFMDKTIELKV